MGACPMPWWWKARFLHMDRKFRDAIAAYQMADNPPQNVWQIVDCHVALGEISQAVANLREIENFFPNDAPRAGLRVAYIYRDAGDKKLFISNLRGVMTK